MKTQLVNVEDLWPNDVVVIGGLFAARVIAVEVQPDSRANFHLLLSTGTWLQVAPDAQLSKAVR